MKKSSTTNAGKKSGPAIRGAKPRGNGQAKPPIRGAGRPRKVLSVYERVMLASKRPYKPLSEREPVYRNPIFVACDMLRTPAEIRDFFAAYVAATAPIVAKRHNLSLEEARKQLKTYAIYQTGLISPKTTALWNKALKE